MMLDTELNKTHSWYYCQKIGKSRRKKSKTIWSVYSREDKLLPHSWNKNVSSIINLSQAGWRIPLRVCYLSEDQGQIQPLANWIFNPNSNQVSLGKRKFMSLSLSMTSVPTNMHSLLISLVKNHWVGCTMSQIDIHRADHYIRLIMRALFAVETFLANTLVKIFCNTQDPLYLHKLSSNIVVFHPLILFILNNWSPN